MITVATYFWRDPTRDSRGYTFTHDHVRILQSMVSRNLTVPHKFVCVCDQAIDDVETVSGDWSRHVPGTVFARLMQHNPEWCRAALGDRVLSLDLDLVVCGSIDHIARRADDFIIWRNPNFPQPKRAFYQSSVQLFSAGARPMLWESFDPERSPAFANQRFGGAEQAWISEMLPWNEAYFSDQDGIYGAGRLGGNGVYTDLPENACIVSFPGNRAPWQAETMEKHPWLKSHYV